MRDIYQGKSEAALLAMQDALQNEISAGQVIHSSIAGVSVTKAQTSGGNTAIERLKAVQYSLWLRGEAQVADATITTNPYQQPYLATVKRTRPSYV